MFYRQKCLPVVTVYIVKGMYGGINSDLIEDNRKKMLFVHNVSYIKTQLTLCGDMFLCKGIKLAMYLS